MSAITGGPRTVDGWRRPSLFGLTASVIAGEVQAAVVLWLISILLGLLAVAPLGGANRWIWLPWRIDGAWALAGAIGWGYLVCAIVAGLVAGAIGRRRFQRPAAGWLRIAIAISGYGAMAVSPRLGDRIPVAVIAGAVAIRLIAFNRDGSARTWPWASTRRVRKRTAMLALLTALSYSGTHAFAATGSGGSYGSAPITARVGHAEQLSVGLWRTDLPTKITAVTFTGPGADHVRSSQLLLSGDWSKMMIPRDLRHYPGAHRWTQYAWSPTRLPYNVPAFRETWVNVQIRLSSCGDATINTLKLHYSVLGIATEETIPLQQPLRLQCGPQQPLP